MTRKRLAYRRGGRGRLAVRLLVLAGALAGLFAMHGLSDHGASSHDMHAPMNPAVLGTSHAIHAADDPQSATEELTIDGAAGQGSPGTSIAGLCLAVLAGAIIALLLLSPHRRGVFMGPLALALVSARPTGRRDRDPPCLFELSVLRT